MKCVCIKCEKELESVSPNVVQPFDGVAFESYGHYGSSIFDPMDGSRIEIVVCDDCLSKAREKKIVAFFERPRKEFLPAIVWD